MAPVVKKKAAAGAGVYGDIVAVLAKPREKGESYPKYIERVGDVMGALPDDEYNKLSAATQQWYDEVVEAVNAKVPESELPPMSGWPADEAPPAEAPAAPPPAAAPKPSKKPAAPAAAPPAAAPAAQTDQETPTVAKKKLVKKAAAAKPAKKKPVVKKAAKPAKQARIPGTGKSEAKARTDGVSYKIRLAVIRKHDISFEDAAEKAGVAKKDAVAGSHAHNMWNHARIICAMIDELGK